MLDVDKKLAELTLQNKILSTFLDNTEAGIYVIDYQTGEVLFANRKTASFGGGAAQPEQLIGHICWKLINRGKEGRCAFCPYQKLLDTDGKPTDPYTWENYFPVIGRWVKIISQVIVWVDGRLAQMNTFIDITEMKKIQEQLAEYAIIKEKHERHRELQTILDSIPLPVRISDQENGKIVYANTEAAKLFEHDNPEDMLGNSLPDYWPSRNDNAESAWEVCEQFTCAKEPAQSELEYRTFKNNRIIARVNECQIEFYGRKAKLAVITNLAAELEQKRLLLSAAEKEREANRLKSSFLSNMSHEIRTPMNAIIGLTDIELTKKRFSESLSVFKKINTSAKSLLQIVNDILDFSKIEANKMELIPKDFELDDVLNSVLLVIIPRLFGKHVELLLDTAPDLPRYLVGDKTRLWQILKNCLDNSAKFTQEGTIMLTLEKDEEQSTGETLYISFEVRDTGIGMNEEQIERALMPYGQNDSSDDNRYTGTGLGMPIAKQICELMGGALQIKSKTNEGTSVRFTLPFAYSTKENTESFYIGSLKDLRILCVDNSQVFLEFVSKLLRNGGATFELAHEGAEALDIIQERQARSEPPFDVILLDYLLDGMNGLELARQICRVVPRSTKLLIVTAYEHKMDRGELVSCGISDVIEKPFSPTALAHKLRVLAALETDTPEPPVSYTQFEGVRALVCEDNRINQEVAIGVLEQFGITAVAADNGKLGLEALENEGPFDVVLMDLHMPVMDGFEAARAIRKKTGYKHIPIICLTADAMTEVVGKCLEAGMDDFLAKPFELNDFHELFLKWIPEYKRTGKPTGKAGPR